MMFLFLSFIILIEKKFQLILLSQESTIPEVFIKSFIFGHYFKC
jgi:hypothetical protein